MKKLLGLLLNCVALCLCSAIGIGAGMYWMQNTQQNSAPKPVIQQVQATGTEQLSQAPNLLSVPPAQTKQVTTIPTTGASRNQRVQQVAVQSNNTVPDPTKTIVTLKVGDMEIGKLNADSTNITQGKEFYLTADELNNINFSASTSDENKVISDVEFDGSNQLLSRDSTATPPTVSWKLASPVTFKIGAIDLKFVLTIKENPSGNTTSETFTFKLHDLPKIASVKAEITDGATTPDILKLPSISLNGPQVKILIEVDGIGENASVYMIKLETEGKPAENLTNPTRPTGTNINQYESTIDTAGVYTVTLTENGKSKPYETRQFTILPAETLKPFISQLTDTAATTQILYDRSNLEIKQLPAYLMRGNKFKLTVPALTGGRTTRVKYREVINPGQATEKKSEFKAITVQNGTEYIFDPLVLSHGTYEVQAEDQWMGPVNPPQELNQNELDQVDRIRLIIPEPTGDFVLKPTIAAYKNQKYPQSADQILITNEDPIDTFGEYLELSGNNGYPEHQPQFLLYNKVSATNSTQFSPANSSDIKVENLKVAPAGNWSATLHLKKVNPTTERVLYVRTVNGVHHAYSTRLLKLKAANSTVDQKPDLAKFDLILPGDMKKDLSAGAVINTNTSNLTIKSEEGDSNSNLRFLVMTESESKPIGVGIYGQNQSAQLDKNLQNGQYRVFLQFAQGDEISSQRSDSFILNVQRGGLEVKDVQPPNFGTAAGIQKLKISFSKTNPLDLDTEAKRTAAIEWFRLQPSKKTGVFLNGDSVTVKDVEYDKSANAAILSFNNLTPDIYQLEVVGSLVKDIFGNLLEGTPGKPGTNYVFALSKPEPVSKDSDGESEMVGVSEFIEYHDYEKRDPPTPGFNPSDKVVTRVARLYYYRDAHRVAQILNSEVKSLNQKGYNEAQITADKARVTYEETAKKRRIQEKKTIKAAKNLREVESEYRTQQQILSGLVRERAQIPPEDESGKKEELEAAITAAQGQITSLRSKITSLSGSMNDEDEKLQQLTIDEENQSAELFRRELQAEKTDLYTIGNGDPQSYDAVRQVTIKVIGEGLIHLRGPIKGVNLIRIMINQIDSPVGQVRIAMHTIQVNGEDGKRMEIVADRIQKSIDQSRFLTVQSSQMLRKAIVSVASEVATSTCQDGIAMSQEERDQKYLYAFFGQDFIEALRAMDSEFLQSGNKLLSIHSMDTTSLSSALFVLALAKNEIRQQILAQFYASIETQLPEAELQFLCQGGPTKANKPKHINLLAPYAHFQSFKGFFDHEVMGTDTMTPIQREFLRLAQIFKARLTTEREYKLHIMERAVIEQNQGDYQEDLKKAREDERLAEIKLKNVQQSVQESQLKVLVASTDLQANIFAISEEFQDINQELNSFQQVFESIMTTVLNTGQDEVEIDLSKLTQFKKKELLEGLFPLKENTPPFRIDSKKLQLIKRIFSDLLVYLQKETTSNITQTVNLSSPKIQFEKFQMKLFQNLPGKTGRFTYGGKEFEFRFKKLGENKEVLELEFSEKQYEELNKITENYIKQGRKTIEEFEWFKLNQSMQANLTEAKQYLGYINFNKKTPLSDIHRVAYAFSLLQTVSQHLSTEAREIVTKIQEVIDLLANSGGDPEKIQRAIAKWREVEKLVFSKLNQGNEFYVSVKVTFVEVNKSFNLLSSSTVELKFAQQNADASRQKLDHKKFLDMQIDETEDKFIDLLEGTRAHTANIDNYLKLIATALEDDFNTQFYYPAFKEARDASRFWNVSFGSMETSSILTNNRSLGKVAPKATIEFDLPKRQLAIIEGMNIAEAAVKEYGALVNDPTFLAITSMNGGENVQGGFTIQPDSLEKQMLGQPGSQGQRFGSAFENLIPDPAVFKFETGTGFTVRPVIQPDGQAVVFDLNYLYRTKVREPVRADEKHLGRIKEHFIDTDVQLGNYELREISRFVIALKASRTANGVPLLSDVPGVGVLFRPTPSAESSLQQSQIMSQAVIYPTLFDLMGLRWAPAVADVGPLKLINREFISKGRDRYLKNRVYDYAGSQVDKFLQIPDSERRSDLYRTQQAIPDVHPNGYMGPGLNLKRSTLEENYDTERMNPQEKFVPERNPEGAIDRDRAIPLTPPAEQGQLPPLPFGTRSSAMPVKDSNIKPAGWNPTKTETTPELSDRTKPAPRFSHRKVIGQSEASRITPMPASTKVRNIRRNQEPAPQPEAKQKSFYKRSAARLKSFFNKK